MESRKQLLATVLIIIGVIGSAVSFYATSHHYSLGQGEQYSCNINSYFSCDKVAQSEYATFFNTPVAVWGLGYFVGLIGIGLTILLSEKSRKDALLFLPFYGAGAIVVSLILAYISVFLIGGACPSCIAVYLISFSLAAVIYVFKDVIGGLGSFKEITNGASNGAIGIIAVLIIHNFYVSSQGPRQRVDLPPEDISDLTFGKEEFKFSINKSMYVGNGEDFRKGPDDAKITVVEFADFECPACSQVAKSLKNVAAKYRDSVRFVFKNYPLDKTCNTDLNNQIHPSACQAALISRCVGERGKFWEFHDFVFSKQSELNKENLRKWATQFGIGPGELATCLNTPETLAKIKDDIAEAKRAGITGTPSVYINGRKYNGRLSEAQLSLVLDNLLGQNE